MKDQRYSPQTWVTWAACTSQELEQPWVLRWAEGAGEDVPEKEPPDPWTWTDWSPVVGTPISKSRRALLELTQA